MKHIRYKDFTIDTEGKDTWRFAKAGAKTILSVAPSEVAIVRKGAYEPSIEDIVEKFEDEIDVVFLEGFSSIVKDRRDIPKVVVSRSRGEAKSLVKGSKNVIAVVGLRGKKILGVPCLSSDKLVEAVERKIASFTKVKRVVRIKVHGRWIPVNPFVQDVVRRTVFGLLSAMKGVYLKGNESLTIEVKRPRKK